MANLNSKRIRNFSVNDTEHEKHFLSVMRKMKHFKDDELFFDVTISIGKEKLSAHRLILAAASPYFGALFNPRMKSGIAENYSLDDFSFEALCTLVDFIYTGKLSLSNDKVQDIVELANYLGIEDALEICYHFVLDHLDSSNALAVWILGDNIQNSMLKSCALEFIVVRFGDVEQMPSKEFCEISASLVQDLLSSEKLYLHRKGTLLGAVELEKNVFQLIMSWVDHDSKNRYLHLPELINKCINWQNLDPKTCEDVNILLSERLFQMPTEVAGKIKLHMSLPKWHSCSEYSEKRRFAGVLCASDHSYGRYPYNRSMPSIAFRSDDLDVPTRVVGMVLHSRLWEGRIVLGGLTIKYSNGKVRQHGFKHEEDNLSDSFNLDDDERIVEVFGSAEWLINSLTFVSNLGKVYGPFCGKCSSGKFLERPPLGQYQYLAKVRGCEVTIQGTPAITDLEFVWGYVPGFDSSYDRPLFSTAVENNLW